MILQINMSMTKTEWIITIILFIILLILIIIGLIMIICAVVNMRVHKSYHKGYNKAKSDKVQYYKVIKELIDSFDKIIIELKKDNLKLSIITTQLLIDFKSSLQEYYT